MPKGSYRHRHLMTVAAGGLALALVAVPVQFVPGDLVPSKSIALADKGGEPNEKSNDKGNNGNSGGGGGGNGPSTGDDNPGKGWAFGRGGHNSHNVKSSHHNPGVPGPNIASVIKWFNAAHANYHALLNAAPNSRVGLIAAYFRNAESTLAAPANSDALADLTEIRDGLAVILADAEAALALDPLNADKQQAVIDAQALLDAAQADVQAAVAAFHEDPAIGELAKILAETQVAFDDGTATQAELDAAQDALDEALADAETDALLAANKGSDLVDTEDDAVIARVRELLGLPPAA